MRKIKISLQSDSPSKEFTIDRFEELFNIQYLPHLECADWTVERWMRKRCEKTHRKGKIGELACWLGKLHSKELDEAHIPDITIRWIHETVGYGIFTNKPFAQWEFIGEYTGILRRRRLIFPDVNDYCFMYPREWISTKVFTIDSQAHGNFTRFINHSDTPNVESVAVFHGGIFHILFRTLKAIPANTELTYDYGDIYWRSRKKQQYT